MMTPSERLVFGTGLSLVSFALRILRGHPQALFRRAVRAFERKHRASVEWRPADEGPTYRNLLEVFEGFESDSRIQPSESPTTAR
jgi:hypothetical protein